MNDDFKKYLLSVTNSSDCEEVEVIQSLWSGYGKIARIKLTGSLYESVIIKHISLVQSNKHPKGWNTNFSHNRKIKSYKVETNWYNKWNMLCPSESKTPNCLGLFTKAEEQWIILEDLDNVYPLRKQELRLSEVKVCLKWLANFHGRFLSELPIGLWEIGTYWHLQTRPEELEKVEDKELKAKASRIDEMLNNCKYQTIVHGDAKVANFCFSMDGQQVAAVDFQYVGGGCGIKDVAYLLGSCLSGEACEQYQDELLAFYFNALGNTFDSNKFNFSFKAVEEEWRDLYPIASADFTRFLLGWMPSHHKVNNYSLKILETVLIKL